MIVEVGSAGVQVVLRANSGSVVWILAQGWAKEDVLSRYGMSSREGWLVVERHCLVREAETDRLRAVVFGVVVPLLHEFVVRFLRGGKRLGDDEGLMKRILDGVRQGSICCYWVGLMREWERLVRCVVRRGRRAVYAKVSRRQVGGWRVMGWFVPGRCNEVTCFAGKACRRMVCMVCVGCLRCIYCCSRFYCLSRTSEVSESS